ncbi:hypothetical protein ACO22_07430, partial [Paracoccidioides brasiliensis]
IDELIAEYDELSHILICIIVSNQAASQNNANKLQNVKSNYHKLIMHNENNYYEFVTKFLHLTEEIKIVIENYKTDFNDKLFFDLQKMIAVDNATTDIYA